jgi:hypothetical protein
VQQSPSSINESGLDFKKFSPVKSPYSVPSNNRLCLLSGVRASHEVF